MSKKHSHLQPMFHGHISKIKPTAPVPGMDSIVLRHEDTQFLQAQALDIFTDMSNAGKPLAESLAAILFTGMSWGAGAALDRTTSDEARAEQLDGNTAR